ncbi:MAG: signal peptidase I [Chloroflexi bacterium HGW-Chloroflexi-1]|nr:MAG: signal peptidase I [Chloroflexi bacterium HGW-Chloroflexi-1]
MLYSTYWQNSDAGGSLLVTLLMLVLVLVEIVALWKVYTKAGQPGWASIIPIYNVYVWLKVIGRPGWWLLLLLVPVVNIIVYIIMTLDLAKSFGRSALYGIGLLLLSPIFLIHLGFSDAAYVRPAAA